MFQKLSKITKTQWFVFGALCCSCLPFVHLGLRHGLQNEFKVNIEPNHTTLAGKLQGEARKLKMVGFFFGFCGRFLRILYLSIIEHLHWVSGHDYEHDLRMASALGMLGSIDCNAGQPYLGWDTDEFPSDPRTFDFRDISAVFFSIKTFSVLDQDSSAWWSWCRKCLLSMLIVVEQGGIAPGGNNFDCKLRRESTDIEESPI